MRRRFLLVFFLILAGLSAYFYFRVLAPLRAMPVLFGVFATWLALGIGAFVWLPLVFWRIETAEPRPFELAIEKFAHLAMGVLSFLLFATVSRDLLEVALFFFGRADLVSGPSASLALLGIAAVLALVGFAFAWRGPVVRRVALGDGAAEPIRLVQISDLHIGTWIRRRYVERVVRGSRPSVRSTSSSSRATSATAIRIGMRPISNRSDASPRGSENSR